MPDVLTPEQRRLNMSRVRGRDTKPEMQLRRALHASGLRFRLHRRDLAGRPDLVFPRYRVCLFVHGCFWHGHNCSLFQMPDTRRPFWAEKIARNGERDEKAVTSLLGTGWRVLIVWECALRGSGRRGIDDVTSAAIRFITGGFGRMQEITAATAKETRPGQKTHSEREPSATQTSHRQ